MEVTFGTFFHCMKLAIETFKEIYRKYLFNAFESKYLLTLFLTVRINFIHILLLLLLIKNLII